MEFMLDSANLNEIKEIKDIGLLGGLTTNPVLIKRAIQETDYKGNFIDYAKKILELTSEKPTFFQVISYSKEGILSDAKQLYENLKPYGNVHIKVPINPAQSTMDGNYEGFNAIKELVKEGIPVLATAVTTPTQAFLASKAGANYTVLVLRNYDNIIAEKLKLGELGQEGYLKNEEVLKELEKKGEKLETFLSSTDILDRTARIFKNQNLESKLIIAGIRSPIQVSEILEREGISAMTVPYKLIISMFNHEATKKFVEQTYSEAPKIYKDFLKHG